MARLRPNAPFLLVSSRTRALTALIIVGAFVAEGARADEVVFPQYDIAKGCRAQADYAFAATLGQTDMGKEIAACSDREHENMVLARTFWPRASRPDIAECLALAEGRYGRLARCLETSRSLRSAR